MHAWDNFCRTCFSFTVACLWQEDVCNAPRSLLLCSSFVSYPACQILLLRAMAEATIKHIHAVKQFLEALIGNSGYDAIEDQQVQNLLDIMTVQDPGQAAQVIVALKSLQVKDASMQRLIERVTHLAAQPPSVDLSNAKRRHDMQDFTMFWQYLKEDDWARLTAQGSFQEKINLIVGICSQLGLRNASEKTVAWITAVIALSSPGQQRTHNENMLFEMSKCVKSSLKKLKTAEPAEYIVALPGPELLKVQYPATATRLADSFPPCPLAFTDLSNLANRIPLRITRRVSTPFVSLQQPELPQQAIQFASQMQQQMQQMQQVQAFTLQALTGQRFSFQAPSFTPASPHAGLSMQPLADLPNRLSVSDVAGLAQAAPTIPLTISTPETPTPALPSAQAAITDGQIQEPIHEVHQSRMTETPLTLATATAKLQEAMKIARKKTKADEKKHQPISATLKKPAAAIAHVPKQKAGQSSKPEIKKESAVPSNAIRMKLRPNGCSKCRQRAGCTPSCWRNRKW